VFVRNPIIADRQLAIAVIGDICSPVSRVDRTKGSPGRRYEIAHVVRDNLFHGNGCASALLGPDEGPGELGKEPKARQIKLDDLLDTRFVAELEREGFFKKLWEK
jgi:hypothetical protein